jgi:hypothetical protein
MSLVGSVAQQRAVCQFRLRRLSDWLFSLLDVAGATKWDAMPHEDGWLLSVWKELPESVSVAC